MTSVLSIQAPRDLTARMNVPHLPSSGPPVAIPRAQVGIERLPARRVSNEPRELMNCKSCRKRKIKCNRLRPACEACQVFQCPCVYDATPKKRGPKGDVLEALLRRVDGLEAKLKDKNSDDISPASVEPNEGLATQSVGTSSDQGERPAKRLAIQVDTSPRESNTLHALSSLPTASRDPSESPVQTEVLLDTYFKRIHAKPYYILDESSVRQRIQLDHLPAYLKNAISAVAARHTPHPKGYQASVTLSEALATAARRDLNSDDPSLDGLQATLLLVLAFTAAGKGKKAYMMLSTAVGIATALELHQETDTSSRATPVERELRRRLFWTCYLLDRFNACGSRRPSLINNHIIILRLPCWSPNAASLPVDGEFFQPRPSQQQFPGGGRVSQGSNAMLINITRILGMANEYLAAGGVKSDSHFPWHALSKLSTLRQELDSWAAGSDGILNNSKELFSQVDSTALVLSKLVFHLIHCLLYRPFLPIDLAELSGNAQHQSWQIEATNICFTHANAISEVINAGQRAGTIEWPSFVGYCICTAAIVHIHGAYYSKQGGATETSPFMNASELLSREMQQLSELRYAWASVQHQRETLQAIYNAHAELVQDFTNRPDRNRPGLQPGDFFERYLEIGGPNGRSYIFDTANLSLSDIEIDFTVDAYNGNDLFAPRSDDETERPNLKRKNTAPATLGRPNLTNLKIEQIHGGAVNVPATARPRQYSVAGTPMIGTGQHLVSPAFLQSPGLQRTPMSAGGFEHYHTQAGSQYDGMYGNIGGQAFPVVAGGWQGEQSIRNNSLLPRDTNDGARAASPGARSTGGQSQSHAQAQGEEKDPFMSFLEQLAETEGRINPTGQGNMGFLGGFAGNV